MIMFGARVRVRVRVRVEVRAGVRMSRRYECCNESTCLSWRGGVWHEVVRGSRPLFERRQLLHREFCLFPGKVEYAASVQARLVRRAEA